MNCQEFRTAAGAEPGRSDPDLEAHAAGCADCAAHRASLRRMDGVLRRAMAVEIEARNTRAVTALPDRPSGRAGAAVWRGWAMAAAAACAVLVGGLLWVAAPRAALASAVVAHMSEEPDAWARTDEAVPAAELDEILRRNGLRIGAGAGLVTYAHECWFRGRFVPHLVVQTDSGPVTVMVLTHERVMHPTVFDEGGYRGVIVPAKRGALAILSQDSAPSAALVSRIRDAVSFNAT